MGPRHGQRAFLATQSASPRRRAFLELKSPKDLAAFLRQQFPQYRGRSLALATDVAPDRLNPRELYWTNATLARDDYMENFDWYAANGVHLIPCLEDRCWSSYWDSEGDWSGFRPEGRDFFFPVRVRPQEQFDVERLLEGAFGERNVTFLRGPRCPNPRRRSKFQHAYFFLRRRFHCNESRG